MDAPDGPAAVPIIIAASTALGLGAQAYGSKRMRDQASDARRRQGRDAENLQAQGRERENQARLSDSVAADRRREKAQAMLAQGRSGSIKTTPIGAVGSGSMGPKYKIGA